MDRRSEFDNLMNDSEDLEVFRQYLAENGIEDLINFYLTCNSVHRIEKQELITLVKAIFKRYINKTQNIVHTYLSDNIRETLKEKYPRIIQANERLPDEFYLNLFIDAKNHIYNILGGALYENFLSSPLYLQRLSYQNENAGDPEPTDYSSLPNAEDSPTYETSLNQQEQQKNYVIVRDTNNNNKTNHDNVSSTINDVNETTLSTNNNQHLSNGFDCPSSSSSSSTLVPTATTTTIYPTNFGSIQQYPYNRNRNGFPILETLTENDAESEIEAIAFDLSAVNIANENSGTLQNYMNNFDNNNNNHKSHSQSSSAILTAFPSNASSERDSMSKTLGRSSRIRSNHSHNGRSTSPSTAVSDATKFYHFSSIDGIAKSELTHYQLNPGVPYQPPHPYHITTNNRVPNSARDSAIQSGTSSDISIVSARSNDRHLSKKAAVPRNPTANSSNFRDIDSANEEKFFEVLIEKLNIVKNRINSNATMHNRLKHCEAESDSSSSNTGISSRQRFISESNSNSNVRPQNNTFGIDLRETIKRMAYLYVPTETESQKILDSHCAQVFDSTPNSGTPTNALQPGQLIHYNGYASAYHNKNPNRSTSSSSSIRSNGVNKCDLTISIKFEKEDKPYQFKVPGPTINLATFKAHVSKKLGTNRKYFNFFFKRQTNEREKRESGAPFYLELLEGDENILPIYDNKIFAEAKEPS